MKAHDIYRYWFPYSRISLALFRQHSAISSMRFFSQAKPVVNSQQQVRELKPYAEQALLHDDAETRNIHHHFLNGLRPHLLKAYQHSLLPKRSQSGERPTVFISYAWCIEELFPWEWWTQPFLVRFAMDLYQLGFDPRLDVLHSRFGPSSIEYMMKELNSADLVFPIGTRSLSAKMVGDRYFQSAIRHEMRGIGDRKVRCAKADQVDGIMPLQLTGSDVVDVFPGHYPQHTVIESFQQPESSYLAMLCDIVKHAYHHFTSVPKLAITKAMMEVESADHSLYSSIQKAKADSVLSLHFHRLSDEAVQRYNEACVAKETTVEQQRLQKTLAFVEQHQQNTKTGVRAGYCKEPLTKVKLHLQLGQDNPYSQRAHLSILKSEPWTYERPKSHDSFIARAEYFSRLAEYLHDRSGETGSTIVVLHGLGGVGKTQLASYVLAHAEVFSQKTSYPLKAWFRAESAEQLQMDYLQFAEEFGIPLDKKQPLAVQARTVKEWLEAFEEGFLVYDNATEEKEIAELLPRKGRYQIVITSRNAHWSIGCSVAVGVMSEVEAKQLMMQVTGLAEATKEMVALVNLLGCLPLALTQSAAYIKATACSVTHYLGLYHQYQADMLSEMAEEGWPHGVEYLDAEGNPQPVWTTFNINFSALRKKEPGALLLLAHCAYLHHQAIPIELLQELVSQLDEGDRPVKPAPLQVDRYIRALRTYSLIQTEQSTGLVNIHQLVQAIFRHQTNRTKSHKALILVNISRYFIKKFAGIFIRRLQKSPELCVLFLPHANHFIEHAIAWEKGNDAHSTSLLYFLCLTVGNANTFWGDLKVAHKLLELGLEIDIRLFGDSHVRTAGTLGCLGQLMTQIGNPEQDEIYQRQALVILEKAYGEESFEITETLSCLGTALIHLGKLEEARFCLNRALYIIEKNPDKVSTDTAATVMQNFATILQQLGDYKAAAIFYEQILHFREKMFGEDHLELAIVQCNLGCTLSKLGEFKRAKELLERSLKIEERFYGEESVRVAESYVNLGILLRTMGEIHQAKEYAEKAYFIYEKFYSEDHIMTATALENLSLILDKLGDSVNTKVNLQRVIKVYGEFYGEKHIKTVNVLSNLCTVLNRLGEYEEARHHLGIVLDVQEKFYGKEHSELAITLVTLGNVLANLKLLDDAKTHFERAVAISTKSCSPKDIATTLGSLGYVLIELGELQYALVNCEMALKMLEEFYGENHIETSTALHHLGVIHCKLGNLHEAEKFFLQILSIKENFYGKNHPYLHKILDDLILLYGNDIKDFNKGIYYYERLMSLPQNVGKASPVKPPDFSGKRYYSTSVRTSKNLKLHGQGMLFWKKAKLINEPSPQEVPCYGCGMTLTLGQG